jgi:threonine synthase
MLNYVSTTGGGEAVDFETAILNGYASDGGLYVPEQLPKIDSAQLASWKGLSYKELAFEILSLFIPRTAVPAEDLKGLLAQAYADFYVEEIIPITKLASRKDTYIMELFHGPTISFKDIGMAFLVNLVDYFLARRNEHLSLVVATTGDTGPAAAFYTAGKKHLDVWVLYPEGKITPEQERQITTLVASNVYPVSVANCNQGGDDLDAIIAKMYADPAFKAKLNISSVNSINWGRVMMQTVHYFYGYLQLVEEIGTPINIATPSGGFGNLGAGSLAREMGLPIQTFVAANNQNACLHRIFEEGIFSLEPIVSTPASAIDILIPMNFWRYLYFKLKGDTNAIKEYKQVFDTVGSVRFKREHHRILREGFSSYSVSDSETLAEMKQVFENEAYLLDPHAAVALQAAKNADRVDASLTTLCLATAHPAKFPEIVKEALTTEVLPEGATHFSIEKAAEACEKKLHCDLAYAQKALMAFMEENYTQKQS